MPINYSNKDILELYVRDNIDLINNKISDFKLKNATNAIYDETDIKNYLKEKLEIEFDSIKDGLISSLESKQYKRSKIFEIANDFILYKSHLENKFNKIIFEELKQQFNDSLSISISEFILSESDFSDEKYNFIKNKLNKIVAKTTYLALNDGFSSNINQIESGVMTANAGDSAQFLFVSRAILAGYNCSNVDVRSSRYDAIIDYKNKLFKVQIKGISDDKVSFKDRDRGGRGIDHTNTRNQGQRITSQDCDIYVAVDKQVGICYIIPMSYVDTLDNNQIKSMKVNDLSFYRENWSIIDDLN